jgi:hypothetical protein
VVSNHYIMEQTTNFCLAGHMFSLLTQICFLCVITAKMASVEIVNDALFYERV